VGWIRF